MTTLIIVAGSARRDGLHGKLAQAAASLARAQGAEVEVLGSEALRLPMFDADLEAEQGMPRVVQRTKMKLKNADAMVFCSPEYNSSVTPLMKNLIDWCSRAEGDDEAPSAVFRGKAAGLLAASPGTLGGLRGLVHLRSILGSIGVFVVPKQFALGRAQACFDTQGDLVDEKALGQVAAVVRQTLDTAQRLRA